MLDFADAYRQALQVPPTQLAAIHQMLTVSLKEANKGTTRAVVLPSGEQLFVVVPPKAFQGQVITISRRKAPTVVITLQVPSSPVPTTPKPQLLLTNQRGNPYPRQIALTQPPLLQRKRKRTRILIVLALIGILITGIFVYVNNYYPDVKGSYTGSYGIIGENSSVQMTLLITQENGQQLVGICHTTLFGITSDFPLHAATIDKNNYIRFALFGQNSQGYEIDREFIDSTPNSGGGWQGVIKDISGVDHAMGSWSVTKN